MLPTSRRRFLRALLGVPFALGATAAGPLSAGRRTEHPDPRPGIDASGVLSGEELAGFGPDVAAVYDLVREMPHIADGIGCSYMPSYRSLLTCFHAGGMAMGCHICQGTARLAHRCWNEGQPLERIRAALDARYG